MVDGGEDGGNKKSSKDVCWRRKVREVLKDEDVSSYGDWISCTMRPNKEHKERRYFSLLLFILWDS